jgi:hypothetical protein
MQQHFEGSLLSSAITNLMQIMHTKCQTFPCPIVETMGLPIANIGSFSLAKTTVREAHIDLGFACL